MSKKKNFNNDWFFSEHSLQTSFDSVKTGIVDWKPVTIPHDWLIEDTLNLYKTGEGWYRKTFLVSEKDPNTRLALRFEGVYMNSTLYVNGNVVGDWKYGYSTFEFDITEFVKTGLNEIYVRVVHQSPSSRWYSGAGIYRSVWLKSYPNTHIAADGIYISTSNKGDAWLVEVDTEIMLGEQRPEISASDLKLRYNILDADGKTVARNESLLSATDKSNTMVSVATCILLEQPELWDISQPYCYKLQVELVEGDIVIETESQSFGFRTMEFDSQKGFFLNGRKIKLHGVCQHHDLGCLGAAVNRAALRRQISLLKEMGVNAIRTAHNMPAVELMDLADEMGVFIVSEAFDMWEGKKTTYDYARFFPEWWQKDVASWVRRDRNHPSLLMWSIGNEIYDTHAGVRGQELTRMLRDEVKVHDPRSNAVITIGSNYMPWENAQKCADLVKIAGYNYAEKYYEQHHALHPDWVIYGSETSSVVQSRGIYHFPLAQSVLADDDEQCSSLGNSSTSWGAKSTEVCIIADRDAEFSPGQFIWSGFDYIGEPTPYHTKNSYFGQLDTAGFKKDSFYIYQAEWTDYRVNPMVHLFPYWDFSEGQLIDVRVCSNAPKIELFLNDKSLGSVSIDHAHGHELLGEWQIPYQKGFLKAVAYDELGTPIATDTRHSFGDAAQLVLKADKTNLIADGSDLIFVEISSVDSEDYPVENANNRVLVTVEGSGRLVGLDNGDSTDYDAYKGNHRRMFSGKLLAVIAADLEPGVVKVRAASHGLQSAELVIPVLEKQTDETDVTERSLYYYRADAAPESTEIPSEVPVRKLEIICPQGNRLTPDNRSLPVQVKLHPSNATYQDVEWRVTNAAGIDVDIAKLETHGHEAVITALGDGDIYIRCATKNGADRIRMYSLMEFHIEGMGQAYLDPYEFVSAGLHSELSRHLTNGNERGVATARDEESWICFENIDFGSFGSDEITLPIFPLGGGEIPIEIWEGVPGHAHGQMIAKVTYQKPSRWNVYQEETYQLPRRLQGITSLSFVLRQKIHLKGFRFTKFHKAYTQLSALDNTQIYGDSFRFTADAVEEIGNNVSLVYDNMDFGEVGSMKLVICGHSPIEKNTIHILLSGPDGENTQSVEFNYSDDYCERTFGLDCIKGMQTVTFVFLPGSRFNLKWIQFLPAE